MTAIKTIKGAKKGQEKARKPSIAKDSASSVSTTKILYGLSEGEIVGLADGAASIRLEGTPLVDENGQPNFEGVTWDFREGTNEQEYIKGFPDVSNETPIGTELKSTTPWVRAINDTQLSAIRVRFRWDRLLQTNDENGDVTGYKIEYAIDLKTDSSAYREVLNTKIEDKTSAGYERTHRIDLPRATTGWQLRIRRITPNSTSEYIQDKMYIDAIAEVIDVKLRYPNTALLGLQYNAETFSRIAKLEVDTIGKIIRVPVNYNAVNKTYSGIWDGTFKDAYSNNPAWIYYDLVTQWRYGIGEKLDDSMIDKWSIYRLGQYCDEKVSDGQGGLEPRFECNVYLQSQEDAYMVLSHLGGIFTAMSYWNGEQIVLDADVPQDPVYTFSAANVVEGNFEYTGTRQRDRHTLAKVAWDNPNNSYQTEYEYIRDEEAMAKYGVKPLDLSAFGCTSQAQAQRLGLRALKAEQLETRQVAFSVGLDGFIPQVGNIINISDELFAGRALSGRVSAVSDAQYVVTLDRDITISSGDVLAINGSNGKTEKRNVKSVAGRKVTLNAPFEFATSESIWALETPTLKLMRFRVMQINQNDDATFNIVALQHDPSKYAGIDNGTDVKDTHNTGNQALQPTDKIDAPTNVVISPRYRVEQGLSITTLVVQWNQVSNAVGYIVELKKDNEAWRSLPRTNTNYIELDNAYAGVYTARVRAVSPFGVESAYAESEPTTIANKIGVPTAPLSLSVYGILFGMQLNWQFGTGSADTAFTEIQQATDPNVEASISQQGIYAYPTDNVTIQGLGTDQYVSYRARLIDKFGIAGAWTDWVEGQTSSDAQAALDLLAGQIRQTQLHQDLHSKIDKIDLIDVNTSAIVQQGQAIADNAIALSKEAQDRIAAITLESQKRNDAILAEAQARLLGDSNLNAAIVSESQARVAENETIVSSIDGIYAQANPDMAGDTDRWAGDDNYFVGVWTERGAIITEGLATANRLDVVTSNINDNKASIIENNKTLVTKTEAIAQQTNTLSAQMVGGYTGNDITQVTSGLIHQEREARATATEGLATQISLLSAGVGEQFDSYEIWHFTNSADGWTGGVYNDGYIEVKSTNAITSPAIKSIGTTAFDSKMYRFVKLRVEKVGMPTWSGLFSWSGGSKTIDEPVFVGGVATIDLNTNWQAGVTGFSIELAATADADNYYRVDWVAVGRPSPAASHAALLREETARASKDLALSQEITTLNAQVNGGDGVAASASIVGKLSTLATNTSAEAQKLDQLKTSYDTEVLSTTGIVANNARAASTAISALATDISGVYAKLDPNMAGDDDRNAGDDNYFVGVWTERSAIIENDVATSQKIDTVTAKANDNAATIQVVSTTQASKTAAVASRVDTLQAEFKDPVTGLAATTALVRQETTARTNQYNSIAQQTTQIQATANSAYNTANANSGLIRQESTARANQYGSIAQQTQTVQTIAQDADDRSKTNQASVQQQSQSIDGLYGQYTLKVDVNGRIAGFGLASTNVASAFSINADRFYITSSQDPSAGDLGFVYNAGTAPDPETGVVMAKGLYLKAAFIKEASISTLKIRGQAVSVTSSATVTGSFRSANLYLNAGGGTVQVRMQWLGLQTSGGFYAKIYKNGAEIFSTTLYNTGGYFSVSETFEVITTGGYSNDTYYGEITGDVTYLRQITMTAVTLKK